MDDATTPSPAIEHDALVVRARTDREAFGELCDQSYPRIFRYCRRRLFQQDAAEEVTADVFLNVARAIRGFAGQTYDDFIRWALAIATNEVNAYLRKKTRRSRLLDEAAQRGAVHVAGGASANFDLAVLDWPSVYQSLLRLTPRDQSIIALRFFEELSHREIAVILDMQPGAVRTAESRALDKLRNDLGVEP